MDILISFWVKMILALVGMAIGTLEFFDLSTVQLWTDVLPAVRYGLGMGP